MTHTPIDAEKVARRELVVARFREIRNAGHMVSIRTPWGDNNPIVSETHAIAEIEQIDTAIERLGPEFIFSPPIDTISMLSPWEGTEDDFLEVLGWHIAETYNLMNKMRKALGVIRTIPTAR